MYTEWMYQKSMAHFGIKGQKWGVRRYQNLDGSLTPEGKARYGVKSWDSPKSKEKKNDLANMSNSDFKNKYKQSKIDYMKKLDKYDNLNNPDFQELIKNHKGYISQKDKRRIAKKFADSQSEIESKYRKEREERKYKLTNNQQEYLNEHPNLEPVFLKDGTFFGYQDKDPNKRRY